MYTDTTIGSDEKKRDLRLRSLARMKEQEEKKLIQYQELKSKNEMARKFLEEYGGIIIIILIFIVKA